MGGFFRDPKSWKLQDSVGLGAELHPYFSGQELFNVVIGEGNDYPYGDFDLTAYMTKDVFEKCQSGEYMFDVKTYGINSDWEIVDKNGFVVFRNMFHNF